MNIPEIKRANWIHLGNYRRLVKRMLLKCIIE